MPPFNRLEIAALGDIIARYPDHAAGLRAQLDNATIIKREQDSRGFSVSLAVDQSKAPYVPLSGQPLVVDLMLRGFRFELEFRLIVSSGYINGFSGKAWHTDDASTTDFVTVRFKFREGSNPLPSDRPIWLRSGS